MSVAERIRQERLIAILRAEQPGHLEAAAAALADEGVSVLEFPLITPEALKVVEATVSALGPAVSVGAGTVLDAEDARRAVEAGAAFLVCPAVCEEAVAYAVDHGVPVLPGALTPTEVLAAVRLGATFVKLFPAATVGPGYLRQVRAPLPAVEFVPTGGITLEEAETWLDAGAVALGVGDPLVGDTLRTGDLRPLRDRARRWRRTCARTGRDDKGTRA